MWKLTSFIINFALTYGKRRKHRPENMTDEDLVRKFRLLMHFQGSGNSSEKEYQEIHDVINFWIL